MREHLHPQIIKNIEQSEKDGGIWLKNLKSGDLLQVQTQNTLYTIEVFSDGDYSITGHPRYCPVPVPCRINGSTWGGSMLKVGFVGIGMCLEFVISAGNYKPDRASVITTSPIKVVELIPKSNF